MSMGMTADEYWNGPPALLQAYRTAYNIRLERDNQAAWLQGLYIYNAVGSVVAGALGAKGRNAKYMDKPIDLKVDKPRLQKRLEEEQAKQKVITQMNAWAARWNAAQKKKQSATNTLSEDGDNGNSN